MEMKRLEIDNSAEAAVKSGRWKNPGSSFYYKILNSFRITDESKDDEDIDKYDFDFRKVLKEAYLIAPVEKIKNSPYGITPYSQSGCKYPHHVIKSGKLVVSVPGIQAAYARAKQQGIFKGDVKSHIEKHYKELGLDMSTMTESVDPIQEEIDLNFDFIQKHIESTLGVKFVHDDVVMESVDDIVDKEQYIKETFDWMDEILYESDDDYNRKIDEENELNKLTMNNNIDDYEFIESVIDAKKELLLAASQLDENVYNQFIDEITVLIEMQESHSTDIIHDEINTDYMGLIQYDDIPNKIMHDYYDEKSEYDPMLNGFLKSYALYEKSHGSLKYEYRIGVDVATGRLVAVEFLLDPKRIRSLGNQDDDLNAYFSKHPEEKAECTRKVKLAMHLLSIGNKEGCDKLLKEVDEYTNNLHEKLFNSRNYSNAIGPDKEPRARIDTLKKFIKKIGHIDYVADATVVHAIFYHGGQSVPMINNAKSVTMVPTLSSTISNFINYLEEKNPKLVNRCKIPSPSNYNLNNDPSDLTISLVKLFNDLTARKEFVNYIKTNGIRGENYTVGALRGFDKFRSTKILWDSVWLYRKFSRTPVLRGYIPNKPIESTTKLVNIYGDTRPYQYDPLKRPKFLKEDAKYFTNMDAVAARSTINKAIDQYRHILSFDIMNEKSCRSDTEEIDFEEKYSGIDVKYDSAMREFNIRNAKYLELRKRELTPISDEEFINEALSIKSHILGILSLNKDNSELIERYNNEIAYLVECKYIPSIKLNRDAINWEYMNLLEHSCDDRTVDVDYWRRKWNGCSFPIDYEIPIYMHGINIPEYLKSYNLCERSNITSGLKYSYQIGADIDTGKLICIRFSLMPVNHVNSIDANDTVDSIMYYDGTTCDKDGTTVHILPIESEEVREFLGKMYNYDSNLMKKFIIMSNDRDDGFILSLSDTFADPKVQRLFVAFVKQFNYQPIEHEVGKPCGSNVYDCTYIPWDPILMYQRFGDAPKFEGPISNVTIKSIGSPSFIDDTSSEYKESYDLNEVNDRLKEIRNNIKKYEEVVQKKIAHNEETINEYITVSPNDRNPTDYIFRGAILTNVPKFNDLNKLKEVKKKKLIKNSNIDLLNSVYEALYPLDPRSYEMRNSLIYDEYLESLELHGIDVSAILNSELPEYTNLLDKSSYLEADDQSEENDQVEDDDTPPNIDLGDEEIESDEPPTIDTDEPESTEEDTPSEDKVQEDTSEAPDIIEPTSLPKATDAQEENKNGVRRKKLYIAFIEWAKSFNQKNTFGSIFDKDAFDVTYPFVPHEMRYFYRLANPILCVLSGSLTFFQVSELRKLNSNNPDMKDALIFAATENDYRVFSTRDKKVYVGIDKDDGSGIAFTKCLADSFDLYIQNMIDQGDILNGPIASESDSNITDENNDSDKE